MDPAIESQTLDAGDSLIPFALASVLRRRERRRVTVVFTDLAGSTALAESWLRTAVRIASGQGAKLHLARAEKSLATLLARRRSRIVTGARPVQAMIERSERRLARLPHDVALLLGRGREHFDQRIRPQPQAHRRRRIVVFVVHRLIFPSAAFRLDRSKRPLEAREGRRDIAREQRARHGAAVSHHLEQRERDIAEQCDVAPGLAAKGHQHPQALLAMRGGTSRGRSASSRSNSFFTTA